MENEEKFQPMGTKIHPDMAVVWDAVCNALGTDTYHMLQQFIYAMIRASSEHHKTSPEIQKLLDALELDPGWQNAINLCAPNGKLSIAQMILILEQEDKTGFGMVMIDKPYCGECRQTENVNLVIERTIEVGLKKLYRKLRLIKADMKCEWLSDVLLTMIDAQQVLNLEEEDQNEMQGEANFSEYGRRIEYGKLYKRKHRKTPDTLSRQQTTIHFDNDDRQQANDEVDRSNRCGDCQHCDDNNPYGKTYCDLTEQQIDTNQQTCKHYE